MHVQIFALLNSSYRMQNAFPVPAQKMLVPKPMAPLGVMVLAILHSHSNLYTFRGEEYLKYPAHFLLL